MEDKPVKACKSDRSNKGFYNRKRGVEVLGLRRFKPPFLEESLYYSKQPHNGLHIEPCHLPI